MSPEQQVVQLAVVHPEHTPAAQVSPVAHGAHASPSVPHEALDDEVSQVPLVVQQPVGQLAELQGEAHRVPLHEVPPVHCWQVPPPAPHAVSELPPTQAPEAQQPPQVTGPQPAAWHVPASQYPPVPQFTQPAPPVPQFAESSLVAQAPPWQHPDAQVAGPHGMGVQEPASQ